MKHEQGKGALRTKTIKHLATNMVDNKDKFTRICIQLSKRRLLDDVWLGVKSVRNVASGVLPMSEVANMLNESATSRLRNHSKNHA